MGNYHVRNYFQLPEADLVAVCDVMTESVQLFAEQYGCKGYTNLDDMLENEPLDAVSITAPTRFHFNIAKKVIEKGIHVLIEKPIADTLEDAQELIRLAATYQVTLTVGHIERFNPAITKLKELVDAGALGKITSLISRRVGAFPAQIKDANVVIDLAVHDIDVFSYLLGKQPTGISGNAGRALIEDREDYADIFLTYGDQTGYIQVNWITPVRIRTLSVTGTKGYAELDYMTQSLTVYETIYSRERDQFGDEVVKFSEPNKVEFAIEKKGQLEIELAHFLACIREKTSPLVDGEAALEALSVALNVMRAVTSR